MGATSLPAAVGFGGGGPGTCLRCERQLRFSAVPHLRTRVTVGGGGSGITGMRAVRKVSKDPSLGTHCARTGRTLDTP